MDEVQRNFNFNLEEMMWTARIKNISELSKKANVSKRALSLWKKGEVTRVDLSTLYKLCKVFDCTVDEIIQIKEDAS